MRTPGRAAATLIVCLAAAVTVVARQPSSGAAIELRWGGDAEGGAPFVEADPARPGAGRRLRRRGRRSCWPQGLGRDAALHADPASPASMPPSARGDFDIGLERHRGQCRRAAPVSRSPSPTTSSARSSPSATADAAAIRTLADLRGRRVATLGATLAYDLLAAAQSATTASIPVTYEDDVHPVQRPRARPGRRRAARRGAGRARCAAQRRAGQPAADVGVGHYVGVLAAGNARAARPDRTSILRAAMRDGRLEAIFRRWEMWNDDQPRLYARLLAGDAGAADGGQRRAGRRDAERSAPGRRRAATCRRCCARPSSRWCCRACRWRWPWSSAC